MPVGGAGEKRALVASKVVLCRCPAYTVTFALKVPVTVTVDPLDGAPRVHATRQARNEVHVTASADMARVRFVHDAEELVA